MATAAERTMVHAAGAPLLLAEDWRALGFSTLAGLATAIGGVLAVIRRPEAALLAFMLGLAIGVMATLSVLELMIQNAIDNGVWQVGLCAALGGAFYVCVEPLMPHGVVLEPKGEDSAGAKPSADDSAGASPQASKAASRKTAERSAADGDAAVAGGSPGPAREAEQTGRVTRREAARRSEAKAAAAVEVEAVRKGNLMRLGLLMAVTMTLHNLPEGFAVAFSSFTDFGVYMAMAVALHNIPEGLIVAAPIYAATGSRRQALGMALASGLSEPVGALIALVFIKPYLTPLRLHLMLAFVGGVMSAVCWIELLPEGRRCKHDGALLRGTLLGAGLMAITLAYV